MFAGATISIYRWIWGGLTLPDVGERKKGLLEPQLGYGSPVAICVGT